jgi:hypothetical protein
MATNNKQIAGDCEKVTPSSASAKSARLTPTVSDRLRELVTIGSCVLPIWVRCPVQGPEHYTGFTRAKLYQLAGDGKIRSVAILEPGKVRGCRLFHLASILDYIARCEQQHQEGKVAA